MALHIWSLCAGSADARYGCRHRRTAEGHTGNAQTVIGEITRGKLDIRCKADAVYLDEVDNTGLYDQIR